MWTDLLHRLRAIFRRNRVEKEIDQEFQFHLQHQIEKHMKAGLSAEEASRRARLEFGGIDQMKEQYRDSFGTRWIEDFFRDCHHGLRVLGRSPVFTLVAIISLALGIGANTAIFSLMDRIMYRSLPVKEPERLVELSRGGLSHPLFEELKGLTSFEGIFGRAIGSLGNTEIDIEGHLEPATFELVTGSYFTVLGLDALIGRTFDEGTDRRRGADPVAVISYRYWERRFASDPAVIGKTFRRLNTVFTIIGVTRPEFYGTLAGQEPDITVPLTMDAQVRGSMSRLDRHGSWWIAVIGRLKPGRTIEQSFAELVAIRGPKISDAKVGLGTDWTVWPAHNGFGGLRRRFEEPLKILMGTVALVLLLACANIANLLLGKAAVRRREIAVRLAMGAGRGRVVRQLLAEGLLLALAGGALGIGLAYAMAESLVAIMSNGGQRLLLDTSPDTRVLLFATAVSLAACFLFSVAPAFLASRHSFGPALGEARSTRWRLGRGLIVAQMAISVVLLIGAGLFGRTLINIYSVDMGFNSDGVTLFGTNTPTLGYDLKRIQDIQRRLLTELRTLPGIESVTLSMYPPVNAGGWRQPLLIDGIRPEKLPSPWLNGVAPDFFKTYGTRVVFGREFDQRDTETSALVAVVNEAFVQQFLQNRTPIGRRLAIAEAPDREYQIVGVVENVKIQSLRGDSPPVVYFVATQIRSEEAQAYAIRTSGSVSGLAPAITAAVGRVDGALRVQNIRSMDQHVERSLLEERMLATLGTVFAGLSVLIAGVGTYGVMAYQVARRRREVGIRMALGASAASVVRMILRQTAALTLLGCVIGVAGGLMVTRYAERILFDIRPNDPSTFAASIGVLLLIALAAAYLPGRSAARTNPVDTLRVD